MTTTAKNKGLTILVILLILVNAATLIFFWMDHAKRPQGPGQTPFDFIVKELQLNPDQQHAYQLLMQEHRDSAYKIRNQIREQKDHFFDLLSQSNTSDSMKIIAAKSISHYTEALDLLTLNHFQKVRALCDPAQQKQFDRIIHQVTGMMSRPPAEGPPPGNRKEEGPPPTRP